MLSVRLCFVFVAALLASLAHAATPPGAPGRATPVPRSVLTPAQLTALPPAAQRAWALQRLALQRSRVLAAQGDVTGPTLKRFENRASVRAGDPLSVRVALDDDLSGVKLFVAFAYGYGGQLQLSHTLSAPERRPNALFAVDVPRDLPADRYFFDFAYAVDEAGNVGVFDAAALASAGALELSVSNTRRGDSQPPTVTEGRVRTPSLSLSATSPGSDHPAYARVSLSAVDTGDLSVAGIRNAGMDFCVEDQSSCFTLYGQATAPGQASLVLTMAGQPATMGVPVGTYRACSIYVFDWAGRVTGYAAEWCGGSSDLGTLLPDGDLITLTP